MYNGPGVEKKWQEKWDSSGLYRTNLQDPKRPKFYNLVMFPYPSGDKLHVGHWYNYGPADSFGRFMRMKGFNVFEPFGFDSFGLPAENYAIKTGVHPVESIAHNCETMRKQIRAIGTMYDWDLEVVTSTPEYYKWTQWIFLQLYKKGLAYRKKAAVNWCPGCQTVLANEQVVDGKCERCKSEVIKKDLLQWFFGIREYAEQLLDYSDMDWPEKTILMQKEWIGKSTGVNINFKMDGSDEVLTAYTTRPDTIYSVTFVVMAPEHPLLMELVNGTEYEKEVREVCDQIQKQTLIERASEGGKNKLGAFLGKYVINPVNGEKIPVYVANFALMYGTGVVMADAHDQRDFEFAQKYTIPLKFVISVDGAKTSPEKAKEAYTADGILFDSGDFTGMNNREALPKVAEWMEKKGFGKRTVNYKLRDWLVSRQRYWGAPIPMIYCAKCGDVPVPEESLPILLPEDVDFIPRGRSPLAYNEKFMKAECPKCGGAAERADETLDTFVDSSWYLLRYPCANMMDKAFEKETVDHWMPVDMYIGGPEHACMHLLYARFIHKVLRDLGYVSTKEPFKRLFHQGLITKNSAKMSKSKGNVVSPDEFVGKYGSDVFRLYLMFMGPFDAGGDWNDKGITGVARFVDRFWRAMSEKTAVVDADAMKRLVHRTIARVTGDIEILHFNTAIAAFMEFVNEVSKTGIDLEHQQMMVKLIAPIAPHLAEELWEVLEGEYSIFHQSYPAYDPALLQETMFDLVVQVNGKVRGKVLVDRGISEEDAIKAGAAIPNVAKFLEGVTVVKQIYVPGKLLSFVVKIA
ncbi:MAG: leucine--tRNA ligase [Patescibacteria group bacterium]